MEVIVWLRGGPPPSLPAASIRLRGPRARTRHGQETGPRGSARPGGGATRGGDLRGRRAQPVPLGPPGTGKTMLAERLPTILPPLGVTAAIEVTSIHSVAGPPDIGLRAVGPSRRSAPRTTRRRWPRSSAAAAPVSSARAPRAWRTGESSSLTRRPNSIATSLDALRQPLESGEVVLARSAQAVFPARFTLVLAANPCPCAKSPGPGKTGCSCSPTTGAATSPGSPGRCLTGLTSSSRPAVSRRDMLYDRKFAEPSAVVAERVAAARERCAARLAGTPWRVNAEVPGRAAAPRVPARGRGRSPP